MKTHVSGRLHIRPAVWVSLATLVFLLHAASYLYFFVDDEGITLVYAKSLLDGRGLTYAATEGPTEGYSNFLHVFTMAGLLALVEAFGLDRMWTFVAGGFVALACGTALLVLLWRTCRRLGLSTPACAASAMLVALSGPLAVWSNSSLETVPFALSFFVLIAVTLLSPARPWPIALAAAATMLLRVDGVLFVGVWLVCRALFAESAARRVLLTRVVPALLVIGTAYLAWRVWYFGNWLTLPLQTKVAHKLLDASATVVRTDPAGYLLPFLRHAGWPLLVGLPAIVAAGFWHDDRRAVVWTVGSATLVLLGYVGAVGDWMFGFRFAVALIAPLALLAAVTVDAIGRISARGSVVAAMVIVAASVPVAVHFERRYEALQQKPSFWSARAIDPRLRFGEYYELLGAVEPLIVPGRPIALHEAGFVPFMLQVENIDMLGLTSRFVGALPSRDAIFTDVGRYYPLTHEPAHQAVHAYLIHRAPELLIVRQSWMRQASRGRLLPSVLDGRYTLAAETATFAVYRREAARDPDAGPAPAFLENLVHPAYAARMAINGEVVDPELAIDRVAALWQSLGDDVSLTSQWTLHVDPEHDVPVRRIYIAGAAPDEPVRIDVVLTAAGSAPAQRFSAVFEPGAPILFERDAEADRPIESIDITMSSISGEPTRVWVDAIRILGQTSALREHLRAHGVPDA